MLSVPIINETGKQIGTESIDPALLGGEVNIALLKQAVVRHLANQRQGSACQKSRGEVEGSTRKLYKQKGTGRARRGNIRTPIMKGGGRAFPNKPTDFRKDMPKRMRRVARNHAILAKLQSNDVVIVDGISFSEPKTKRLATLLKTVQADHSCVLATAGIDANLHKSGRNLSRTHVTPVTDLNAYEIISSRRLIFTRDAFSAFRDQAAGKAGK